jgi:hypothetical protein
MRQTPHLKSDRCAPGQTHSITQACAPCVYKSGVGQDQKCCFTPERRRWTVPGGGARALGRKGWKEGARPWSTALSSTRPPPRDTSWGCRSAPPPASPPSPVSCRQKGTNAPWAGAQTLGRPRAFKPPIDCSRHIRSACILFHRGVACSHTATRCCYAWRSDYYIVTFLGHGARQAGGDDLNVFFGWEGAVLWSLLYWFCCWKEVITYWIRHLDIESGIFDWRLAL